MEVLLNSLVEYLVVSGVATLFSDGCTFWCIGFVIVIAGSKYKDTNL